VHVIGNLPHFVIGIIGIGCKHFGEIGLGVYDGELAGGNEL